MIVKLSRGSVDFFIFLKVYIMLINKTNLLCEVIFLQLGPRCGDLIPMN